MIGETPWRHKQYTPTRQPRAYMQKNLREGRWHILTSPLTRDCRLWHNCEQYGNTQDLVKHRHIHEARYLPHRDWPVDSPDLQWRCVECNQVAPDGLVAVYVMLDWKRSTDEISEAIQEENWADEVPF